MSVLLWTTEPILIMLLAVLVLRERIAPTTMIAIATALIGAMLLIYRPAPPATPSEQRSPWPR